MSVDDHILGDTWANTWRWFLAKRFTDALIILVVFWLFASEYEKLGDMFWPMMGFALAASAAVWCRDILSYWVLSIANSEERRYPRSTLAALRNADIDPENIRPARLEGLAALSSNAFAKAEDRVAAAALYASFKGIASKMPWYSRAHAEDLIDAAILRYTLENRREQGLADDDESEDDYFGT